MGERYSHSTIPLATSFALFGSVAVAVTRYARGDDSSEDLGGSGFDDEHIALEGFVQSVPKVELHVHLDGAFDPEELWQHLMDNPHLMKCLPVQKELPWAKDGDDPLPVRDMVENCESALDFRHLCTCRRRFRSLRRSLKVKHPRPSLARTRSKPTLEEMLTCFEFFLPLINDNLELLEHLASDFVKRQYEQNVIYTEVRYSPHFFASDAKAAHAAVTRGLRKACELYPVKVNQILCAINFRPDWSDEVVEMANSFRNDFPCAVVGVDIASGENHFSHDSPLRQGHFEMCQKAKELGLNVTIHAGETPDSAQNVQTAIDSYGAKRIGHGYNITNTPEIMDHVKARNIHLEVCLTSSVETGGWEKTEWKDHPSLVFREWGISQSLSSDDPAVFNTSLTWQYRIAMKKMGLSEDDILRMTEDAIQAAFISKDEKTELLEKARSFTVEHKTIFRDRVHYEK